MTLTGPRVARTPTVRPRHMTLIFDEAEFLRRLLTDANTSIPIGEALRDPRIITGIGSHRRAAVLCASRIDPRQPVGMLSAGKLERLCRALARTDFDSARSRVDTAMS